MISSASTNQPAMFMDEGVLSFSYLFWTNFLRGAPFYDAWVLAKNGMGTVTQGVRGGQMSQLDANGNAIPNEKEDLEIAGAYRLGNQTALAWDMPGIGGVSPARELTSGSSALMYAEGVVSVKGIRRVWAMITPPGYVVRPDQPILDIPVLEMVHTGGNRWEGTYRGFTTPGTYHINIFATDDSDLQMTSPPKSTSVTVIGSPEASAERIFNAAEDLYPEWFSPARQPVEIDHQYQYPMYYRYYSARDIYLLVYDGVVYYHYGGYNRWFTVNEWLAWLDG